MTSELSPLGDALIQCLTDIHAALDAIKEDLALIREDLALLLGDADFIDEEEPQSQEE